IVTFPIIIQQSNKQMDTFRLEAQEHLGTSNFTISSEDGYMVATEPNGTRWPTQAMEDKIYQNQFVTELEIFGIGALLIIVITFVVVTYQYKHQLPVTIEESERE